MKKIIAIIAAAVVLCACGCTRQRVKEVLVTRTSEEALAPQTSEQQTGEDVALPAFNDSGTTTQPVVTQPTQSTTVFRQAPVLQAIEQAQNAAETTTAATTTTTTAPPQASEPGTPDQSEPATQTTTVKPTETTTQAPKAELLQSAVLEPINSGTYTITISAFGNDHSSDDKLSKIVRGGETAYWLTIPAAGLTCRVFPSGGKYYLATPTKYCELTKTQYNTVCKSFNNAFINFSSLKYQKTETVRDGLKKYTCEYFDLGGSSLVLWYSGGSLVKMEIAGESLPITVSGGADSAYFTLDPSMEKVEYSELESIVSLAGAFFG